MDETLSKEWMKVMNESMKLYIKAKNIKLVNAFEYPLLHFIHYRQHPTICRVAAETRKENSQTEKITLLSNIKEADEYIATDYTNRLHQTLVFGNETNNSFIIYY